MLQDDTTPYQTIGEEKSLRLLVDRFYHHMETNPNAKNCRNLHKGDLAPIAEKLFDFLSGWLGGPQLFIEKYGHPMMRKRHFPFAIGPQERDEWLLCMRLAMDEMKLEAQFDHYLYDAFRRFAEHMRNRN